MTAQGADHTAGNLPKLDCREMDASQIVAASFEAQRVMAASDSLGLCIFGRGVTDTNVEFIIDASDDTIAAISAANTKPRRPSGTRPIKMP